MPDVILVNHNDEEIGVMEKMEAHRQGLLHRAFSIFIFDSTGRMLLQQRALNKYHSPGIWSNTCCSHPYPGESTDAAASRRLFEEMGFQTRIDKLFDFTYKVAFNNGLIEHEFDHVYIGTYDGEINYNPEEVMNYSFKEMPEILTQLSSKPDLYTEWFKICFPKLQEYWKSLSNS